MFLFFILVSCSEPLPDLAPPGAPPAERGQAIDADLQAAHQAWLSEDRAEASRIASRAYREHFEPMEPLLREHDPLQTLQLEYRFGHLIQVVGSDVSAGDVTRAIGVLRDGVAGLVRQVDPVEATSVPSPAEETQSQEG